VDIILDIIRVVLTNHEVLQLFGLVISALVIWILGTVQKWIGLRLRTDRQAALNLAVDKAITLGIVRAEQIIHQRGWGDIETKSEIVGKAIPILEDKFRETLRENGLDVSNEQDRMKLIDMMSRMLPDVMSRAAASPATPPSEVVPVAIIPPPSRV
jgi:hypothetical protein